MQNTHSHPLLFLFSALSILSFPSLSFAQIRPSFDCTKAKTPVEKMICGDKDLAYYDFLLNKAFGKYKSDKNFKMEYNLWLKKRDQCSGSSRNVNDKGKPSQQSWVMSDCLQKQYATIFDFVLNTYDGFGKDFVPHQECFRPLLPMMNGDQGFYAMRVISSIRACDNLNFNVERPSSAGNLEISFLKSDKGIYYYQVKEPDPTHPSTYQIGVKFELKTIILDKKEEKTLVMSLVESSGG